MSDPDLKQFQRFPVVYPAQAQFKNGAQESAGAGATAKLAFNLNNNPHEITGLRLQNVYEVPPEFLVLARPDGMDYLQRLDGEQVLTMRMAQQNVVVDETLQKLVTGSDGIHWHPFELPYPMKGGNNVTVDVTRITGYTLPGTDPLITVEAVTCYAALVGWMYVGPNGVLSGPPSTGFNEAALRT